MTLPTAHTTAVGCAAAHHPPVRCRAPYATLTWPLKPHMPHPTSPTTAPITSPPRRGEGPGVGGHPPEPHHLSALEHTLWCTKIRHDRTLMEATFAPYFHEFGRSGRRYTRDDLLPTGKPHPIDATLRGLTITDLSPTIALITYISELRRPAGTEWANRSSLWDRATGRWQLRFHQGTPCEAPA